jgi:hypothetical protein
MVANAVANSCIPYWFPWVEAEDMIIESDSFVSASKEMK